MRREGREWAVIAAAVMVLTTAIGVGAVLLLPKPRPAPAVELARPAPVATSPLPAWAMPAPPPAQPAPNPPPLRLRTRELASAPPPRPTPRPAHARAIPARTTTPAARPGPCRAPATVADRLVCQRPQLAAQERALRRAYDRALAAGADRLAVDRAQAQWRGRRDRADSEDELARLYARRIAELDAIARQSSRRRIYG